AKCSHWRASSSYSRLAPEVSASSATCRHCSAFARHRSDRDDIKISAALCRIRELNGVRWRRFRLVNPFPDERLVHLDTGRFPGREREAGGGVVSVALSLLSIRGPELRRALRQQAGVFAGRGAS